MRRKCAELWKAITTEKQAWIEPQNQGELEVMIKDYEATIRSRAGALFFAVCRGKVRRARRTCALLDAWPAEHANNDRCVVPCT